MAKNDDANKASDERLEKAKEFKVDFYGKMPQREGFEGETMGITGLNNSLTDLYNTLALLREKELQNKADKDAIAVNEGYADSKSMRKGQKVAKLEEKMEGLNPESDKYKRLEKRAKRKGGKKGKQFVKQPKGIAKKTARYRK